MKWKITVQFLALLVITMVISLCLFMIMNIFLLYSGPKNPEKIFSPHSRAEAFTIRLADDITLDGNKIAIKKSVLKSLEENGLWIQVLDEDGSEIYGRFTPKNAQKHYTAGEIIFLHKYTGGVKGYSVYGGILKRENRNLSYLVGFPENKVAKFTFNFSPDTLLQDFLKFFGLAAAIFVLISLGVGYLFSNQLAKPILKVVKGIQLLAKGEYGQEVSPKGIYKSVLSNLNELSQSLNENERVRNEMEDMREEWITNITHDLKTPLASIKGYAEIISDKEYDLSDQEKNRYTHIILNKAEYIGELVEDLNLTYRLKNPSFPLAKKQENLVELIRDSVIEILNHPLYEEISIDFQSNTENVSFLCDKLLMKRAFANLIYNAIVHNSSDVEIKVSIIHSHEGMEVKIEDNGKGIPEKDLEKLFERYYRGTNTGEAQKGSGLGLAITKQIIEAHGGEIKVSSEMSKGTAFLMHFSQE
ncbi:MULTISPECIES: sensor histidine kinase KdpD [unclassified Bacillus (in: firmicutes)]|uniref:sensor histidine kinase n=1 Tax=unclassified Bacillus (in: firmicutes) TaxID=185979 RepID=UPI0008ECF880|nr:MULTISPECIES: HAMP domain-containing sensor histidine kinase [unclassified Bacillus (in: firmicutes)]SFB06529.1 His Kinase A (phospho-acceptor) domain-containing protein [Bacillus sp. UNCCL13]SFQ87651.1 His Kinase A (phospho-acceptor) domain-containing protein [Bacillus sp. cl95]